MRFNTLGTIASAAAIGVMVATSAQAGPPPCDQITTYREAVIEQFEDRVGSLPADLMTPDMMQMAASRFSIQKHGMEVVHSGGESTVTFKMNDSEPQTFNCQGRVTDVPGLERFEDGQSQLMQTHRDIVQEWIIAR